MRAPHPETCSESSFARPAWTTGTTLPAAFVRVPLHSSTSPIPSALTHALNTQVAGIIAGVLIYWGGRKTRRTEQVEDRLRTALEMEHEQKRAPGPAPAAGADTASTTVEEAGEAPERMPCAAVDDNRDEKGKLAALQVAEKGADADADDGVVRRDAEKGLDPLQTSAAAAASSRTVHVVEEMVVPRAEDLHPATASQ